MKTLGEKKKLFKTFIEISRLNLKTGILNGIPPAKILKTPTSALP